MPSLRDWEAKPQAWWWGDFGVGRGVAVWDRRWHRRLYVNGVVGCELKSGELGGAVGSRRRKRSGDVFWGGVLRNKTPGRPALRVSRGGCQGGDEAVVIGGVKF